MMVFPTVSFVVYTACYLLSLPYRSKLFAYGYISTPATIAIGTTRINEGGVTHLFKQDNNNNKKKNHYHHYHHYHPKIRFRKDDQPKEQRSSSRYLQRFSFASTSVCLSLLNVDDNDGGSSNDDDKNHNHNNNQNNNKNYSPQIRLREEVESPFRKVRFFFYMSIAGGAATSLAVSFARIVAAYSGINTELLQESQINALVDIVGLIVVAKLFQNDLNAEESKLQRALKGAELAKLPIRLDTRNISMLLDNDDDDNDNDDNNRRRTTRRTPTTTTTKTQVVTLASLRRGRGIDKRVIIVGAGEEKIRQVLKDATELSNALSMNDLLVVPVVLPQCRPPPPPPVMEVDNNNTTSDDDGKNHITLPLPDCVALPVVNNNWKSVMEQESIEARKQNVDIENDGFCIVLKKNGRVGQRTKGIFLSNMIGEVTKRREFGLDVKNI